MCAENGPYVDDSYGRYVDSSRGSGTVADSAEGRVRLVDGEEDSDCGYVEEEG